MNFTNSLRFACASFAASAMALSFSSGSIAAPVAPIAAGDVIFTDGYGGWHKIDPKTWSVTALPWPDVPSTLRASTMQFDLDGAILYFGDFPPKLLRLNPSSGKVTSLELPEATTPRDFVVEPNGDLLLANLRSVARFSRSTGTTDILPSNEEMALTGIAQTAAGRVFVTDFGTASVYEVDPLSGVRSWVRVRQPSFGVHLREKIEARSDGDLIVTGRLEVSRIDPANEVASILSRDVPSRVEDSALDADDNLWLASNEGVWFYDGATGERTVVFDDFMPHAIAVVPQGFVPPRVPEPGSGWLTAGIALLMIRRSKPRLPSFCSL